MRRQLKKCLTLVVALLMCLSVIPASSIPAQAADASSENLALNKPVQYSDVEGGKKSDGSWTYPQFVGEYAVDGDETTRWSAGKTDSQWLIVDLEQEYAIDTISISFHAESPEYDIMIAAEDGEYETIASVRDGSQGNTCNKVFTAEGKQARYIKYQQNKMWLHSGNGQYYGSSIIDIDVREKKDVSTSDDTIRVGTFNIAANKNPDVNALRALSENYNLEVLGLQEVDRYTGRNNYDMMSEFAGDTYPYMYFSKAIDHDGGEYGIATVSKLPMSDSTTVQVDSEGATEQRVFQRSVITKEGRTIAFYNTHLSYETRAIRTRQMEQLKEAVENDPVEYKIIVGDFNADQSHDEFNMFLEELDMVNGREGEWYDTFNGVDETMKVNSVDNILITRNLEIVSKSMIETNLSDHNMLIAQLRFLDEAQVSKEWLRVTLDEVAALDETLYTEESYAALHEAVIEAQAVYEKADATQDEVDEMVGLLKEKQAGLKLFNLAYGKTATASGTEVSDGRFTADLVTDGEISSSSRWSGAKEDEQWLMIDLGDVEQVSEVILRFESESPEWELQVSIDGEVWKTVFTEDDGGQGTTEDVQVSFEKQPVRYIKYVQHKMWLHSSNGRYYSTSIYELEAYEEFLIDTVQILNEEEVISTGETFQIDTQIMPSYAAHKPLVYSSSDEKVATVDENGLVCGVGAGKAVLTVASAADPTVKDEMQITVVDGEITAQELRFAQSEKTITTREKRFLEYTVYPSNAVDQDLEVAWKSSDEHVVSINDEGMISAVTEGSAVITVYSVQDPQVKGEITIHVSAPTYNEDYDVMKDRWQSRVVGSDLDMSDPDIAAYVQKIDQEGQALWASLNKSEDRTTLWEKLESDTTSADYTTQFTKIKKLALAFGVEGSSLYENKDLLHDILSAVDFMVTEKNYNGSYSTGNWWDWQIGCTQPLVDLLMIISDYTDYQDIEAAIKSIEGYAKRPSIQWPSYTATGANRTDIGLSVLGSAILAKNDERMTMVKEEVPDVMKLVTSGDGLYADGSVIQHTKHAYNGSYGNELLKGVGKITSIIAGTDFEITDSRINNVYETVINGYLPLMHKGQMMSMVNGRSISRAPGTNSFTTEFAAGSETIANILLLAQSAPEQYSTVFKAAVKYWLNESAGWYDYFGNARDFDALLQAKDVMNDESIEPYVYTGMKVYGSMDRVVQVNDDYTVGLSMYSSRIYNYEFGNTENKRGWHTGDGVLYIYNDDLAQYGEGYWPTVDAYRLPGTTVDTRTLADGAGYNKTSPQSWVGGATDGVNGTAAMYYNTTNLGLGMDLKAQKAWFFLDGKIVALGANINGSTDATIETTVENRMMTSDDNAISVNGANWDKDNETMNMEDGSYVHFTGTGVGNDLGYYFIQGGDVYLTQETRTGSYTDINEYFVSDTVYEKEYFKMGINHGQDVSGGSYEYVILPGATEAETAAFAKNNSIRVIRNDETVQAVADDEAGIFAMNTWPESEVSVEGVTVNNSASVYIQTKNGVKSIYISDPKQKNVQLTLTLEDGYDSVIAKDDSVTVNADGSFTIDTTGSAGASHEIIVSVSADKEVLNNAISEAQQFHQEEYTAKSWNALQSALTNAKAVAEDDSASQEAIDDAANALNSAISALQMKASNAAMNALQNIVEKANALQEDALAELIANAQALLDDPNNASTTAVVSAMLDLSEAMAELNESESSDKLRADLEATIAFINENILTNVDNVRPGKVDALKEAIQAAQDVLNDEEASADALKAANKALTKAAQELWQIVSKEELNALIDAANGYLDGDYTGESIAVLQDAINNAQAVADNDDATTAQVTEAISELASAIAGLESVTLDTSALAHEIELAEQILANIDDYVSSTVEGLQEKVDAAKAAMSATSQDEIDEATKTLREARLSARTKADKSALEAMIAEVNAMDLQMYTEASVNDLRVALINAQQMVANEEATQKEVNDALKALDTAVNALTIENVDTQESAHNDTGVQGGMSAMFGLLVLSAGMVIIPSLKRSRADQR